MVRCGRYAGTVWWVQWYGAVGTLVRYGGTAQGHTVPQQAYQNLESFHNQFHCTFDNQFHTFDNQFCTFDNQILGTLRWYGGGIPWVRCTVPLYHHTVPLHRTVPDSVPNRTYQTTVPFCTPYPTVPNRTQPYVPQEHPKPHSYVPGPSEDPIAYCIS